MDKKLLRQQTLTKRDTLTWLEVQSKSQEIAQRLFMLPEYHKAQTILIYLAFAKEVATQAIIMTAWQEKKRILVPVCQTSDKSLLISELRNFNELTSGTWNIPEPKKDYLRPREPQAIDLAIIPGLAFDLRGSRLGYGAGYYDRFLSKLTPTCPKVALAYEFSLIEFFPTEPHDIPMDYIITEVATYKINTEK